MRAGQEESGGKVGDGIAGTVVLHPYLKSASASGLRSPEARLEEAMGLARAINLEVIEARLLPLSRVRPGTFIGAGQVEETAAFVAEAELWLIIVDASLSPVQQRNLERELKCKVLDRTGLILEIFGERARTAEGRMQVDLAHLTYQRSRLVRSWTHLERQRGGRGFMGGPGEAQIEADRRQIGERIARLTRQLEEVRRTRRLHREARRRVPYPVVALVGYTNAGKSTLFNRLTRARVQAENLLFATLDPTMREVTLPSGRRIILSDTVGFISDLPTELVAAFRATLEEVRAAEIIVHVEDISHPDAGSQAADVRSVLADLGVGGEEEEAGAIEGGAKEIIRAWNKLDLLSTDDADIVRARTARDAKAVMISAVTGEGCEDLLLLLDQILGKHRQCVDITVPQSAGELVSWLYQHGEVREREDQEEVVQLRVLLDPEDVARFKNLAGPGVGVDFRHQDSIATGH